MKDPFSNKKIPGTLLQFSQHEGHVLFETLECSLKISVVSNTILRFTYAPYHEFERDFSYAVVLDKHTAGYFQVIETNKEVEIKTQKLVCRVAKNDLKVILEDLQGNIILEDEKGFHWEDYQDYGGNLIYNSKKISESEVFLGFGDKPTDLDLRGKLLTNWGSDMFGYEKNSDPLYKNIPFYYGLHQGISYGIFLDNTFKTTFDFGFYNYKVMSFWADGGEMDYYFMYGPDLLQIAKDYVQITGLPKMPPIWSLGYQQSRWSYAPENEVKQIANQFREKAIPCDVIYLDIDYMDAYKCFTWDDQKFPNPANLAQKLAEQGFKLITIIDPGIKIEKGYEIYENGLANNFFCKRGDGPLMKGSVWPGECNFPDFTNPNVREWWAQLIAEFGKIGIAGIWNDMNEPAVFGIHTFPNDVRHNFDGEECSHRKAHNVYGMQMARATQIGMEKWDENRRTFSLTRSGFAGVQRYAAVWTGDNLSTWEHLWLANIQCQRLSISGLSFCGSDIGGFIGNPDGELFLRWIQLALFHPLMRGHSSKDYAHKEPWVYPEPYFSLIQSFIKLRYSLLPYFYTQIWKYTQDGTPFISSLCFGDQTNRHTYYRKEEFYIGDKLLACPVSAAEVESRIMFLPKGEWYHFFTNDFYVGNREIVTYCPISIVPFFVKAGTVLPLYPTIYHTGEINRIELVSLNVYFGNQLTENEWFEDDGTSLEYQNGNYSLKKFFTYYFNGEFSLEQTKVGNYNPLYNDYEVNFIGIPYPVKEIKIDGQTTAFTNTTGKINLQINTSFRKILLVR